MRQILFRAVAMVLAAGSPLLADTIRTEGGTQAGTIISSTRDAIKLSKGGSPVEIPTNEVIEIGLDAEPYELKSARRMVENGQYNDAVEKLQTIQAGSNEMVAQEIAFMKAYSLGKLALAGAGDRAAAGNALLGFVTDNPDSFHFYEVARMLGDVAVSNGDYAAAAKYYGGLARAPWPDYKLSALVLEGRALLAQNKAADALQRFDQVLGAQASVSGAALQKSLAAVGKAKALALTGDPNQGATLAQKVIDTGDPSNKELFGRAYNALGLCYEKQDKTKDALLAYLHTDILFYNDPEIHAEALYHLANLWKAINDPDRATDARNLLTDRYPGSTWANRQ
ncbi:tetratricopeptide repeat protein [bacterium]|nr:tetratricopeptide repeat protein [bacterium]